MLRERDRGTYTKSKRQSHYQGERQKGRYKVRETIGQKVTVKTNVIGGL